MMLLSFPEYRAAAQLLASTLKIPAREVSLHRFPDGESQVRLPEPLAQHVIICRSLFNPNDKLIELMLTAAAARAQGASTITLVAPYLCYMRQDIAFSPGEAISQRIIGEFLGHYVDEVITVDPHLHRTPTLAQVIPGGKTRACSSAVLLGAHIRQHAPQALLVGPDSESAQWTKAIAKITGQEYVIADKTRLGDRSVQITLPEYTYQNRDAVIIDDIASTGRTISAATLALKQAGVQNVDTIVTHALFMEDAEQQIHNAGVNRIWSTDSIPHASNAIPLAPVLAQAITDTH